MYLGTQVQARNDDDFKQWAQLGVLNVCSDPPGSHHLWSEDDLLSHKEKLIGELDMVQIPLSSQVLEKSDSPNIMLGKSPQRDEIESIQI